jgi:hypothetical protein
MSGMIVARSAFCSVLSFMRVVVAVLLLGWCPAAIWAQTTSATVVGTLTDTSGARVAGATVSLKDVATGIEHSTTTDANGEYVIPDLKAAHYSVTFTMTGFRPFIMSDVELLVAQRATLDGTLQVGQATQVVTVDTVAPMVDTTASEVGQVVNTVTIEHVPLNGRSFWQLTNLVPGVTYTPGGQGTHTGGSSIRGSVVAVNVNGGPPDQTGWLLDGAFITEMQSGGTMIQPDIDALQEFKVEGAMLPAEFGLTANMINVTTKSGTNHFHGTAFEFLRNSALDARNFFYIAPVGSTHANEPLRRNQYGFTFGGPIVRNKVFFFTDYERTALLSGVDFSNIVPTLSERTGNFSDLLSLATPQTIKDPLTGKAFPGNIIPAARLAANPPGQFFVPYLPLPNQLRGTTSYNTITSPLLQHLQRGDGRVDYQINEKNQIFGRYSINDNSETDPNQFTTLGNAPLSSRGQNATAVLTHVWSPSWLSEARMSYYRSIFHFGGILQGTNFNQEAGVQGFNDTTSIFGFPQITMTNYATFVGSPSDQRPKSNQHRNLQFNVNTTYSHGNHSIKFGADLYHERAGFINGSNAVGVFNFSGIYSGNAFADFLLGSPDNVTRDYYKELNGDFGYYMHMYAQDSYRLTQRLTLNVGFRVERNTFYQGINGGKTAFDPATQKIVVPSNINPNAQLLTPQLLTLFADRIEFTDSLKLPWSIQPAVWSFVPRFGVAWRAPDLARMTNVVRAGYGIFQLYTDLGLINNELASVPFIASTTVVNDRPPVVPTRTWSDFFLGQPNVSPNPNPGKPCPFGFVAITCATPNAQNGPLSRSNQYVQQWTAEVQSQIASRVSVNLTYLGTKTTHLQTGLSSNDPLPGPGAIQPRRPYPQWGVMQYDPNTGYANYNAFQAKLEMRSWHSLTLLAGYAYSKCMDSSISGTLYFFARQRAVCDYDFPQVFSPSFNYALPVGAGRAFLDKGGWVNQVVGGWQMAGIWTLRSGAPFTPTISGDTANTGVSNQWPLRVGTPKTLRSPNCWFYVKTNSNCVALSPGTTAAYVVPAQYTYGTPSRNTLRADDLNELDFTLLKGFSLGEARSLEFRTEFFNMLNHPTFAAPSTTINSGSGGQVSATLNSSRQIQFGLKFAF